MDYLLLIVRVGMNMLGGCGQSANSNKWDSGPGVVCQ